MKCPECDKEIGFLEWFRYAYKCKECSKSQKNNDNKFTSIRTELIISDKGNECKEFDKVVDIIIRNLIEHNLVDENNLKISKEEINDTIMHPHCTNVSILIPDMGDEKAYTYNEIKHQIQDYNSKKGYTSLEVYNKFTYALDLRKDIKKTDLGMFDKFEINVDKIVTKIKDKYNLEKNDLNFSFYWHYNIYQCEIDTQLHAWSLLANSLLADVNKISKEIVTSRLKKAKVSDKALKEFDKISNTRKNEGLELESKFKKARELLFKELKKNLSKKDPSTSEKQLNSFVKSAHYLELDIHLLSVPYDVLEKNHELLFEEMSTYFTPLNETLALIEVTNENLPRLKYDWKIKVKPIQNGPQENNK